MRRLICLMVAAAALGLLGVSASGAGAAAEGTMNVGPQPNSNPFEGGCQEGRVCIWSKANYSGQLSWWAEGNTGCKNHENNPWFRSFFNATSHDSATFGGAGKYYAHSGAAYPGAYNGLVCIVYGI